MRRYSKILAALLATPLLIGGVAPMNASATSARLVVTANNNKTTINVGQYTTITAIVDPLKVGGYFENITCQVQNGKIAEKVKENFSNTDWGKNGNNSTDCKIKGLKAGSTKILFSTTNRYTSGIWDRYYADEWGDWIPSLNGDITITVTDKSEYSGVDQAGPNQNLLSDDAADSSSNQSTTSSSTPNTTSTSTASSSSAKVKKSKISSMKASSTKLNPGEATTITVKHNGASLVWTITDKKGALESIDCKENSTTCTIVAKNRIAAKSSVKIKATSQNPGAKAVPKKVSVTVKKSDLTPEYAEEVATKADQFAAQAASATIGTVDGYSPKSMKAALKKAFKKAGYKSKVFTYPLASTGQPAWFGHANQINWNDQAMRMIAYRMIKKSKTYTDGWITKFLDKEKFGESYINYVIGHRAELINSVKVPDLDSVKSAIVEALMSQKGLSQSDAETYVNAHVK